MSSKPLFQELSLPLVQGYLVGIGRDPVPERLYVVDLVVDGKVVEPRGRHTERLRHFVEYTCGGRDQVRQPTSAASAGQGAEPVALQ